LSGATQRRVRSAIEQVGGYWSPLAGLARLLEELGELAESKPGSTGARGELADLWIISTAIADQFLGEVAEPGSTSRIGLAPDRAFAELLIAAGTIARIVNFYDGPKAPRSRAGWPSLAEAVASFHSVLGAVARMQDIELQAAVQEKLDAIPARDADRFERGFQDPSTAPALAAFRAIETSALDFQPALGRLWGAPPWPQRAGAVASGMGEIASALVSFTRAAETERLDAYVIPAPPCESPALLDAWMDDLLEWLAALDPSPDPLPRDRPVGPRTAFAFNGVAMRLTLLSPLFAREDPLHCETATFAVFEARG
jgi:NTP pyrophosphatase (non-canonical NTP hydrolase)